MNDLKERIDDLETNFVTLAAFAATMSGIILRLSRGLNILTDTDRDILNSNLRDLVDYSNRIRTRRDKH